MPEERQAPVERRGPGQQARLDLTPLRRQHADPPFFELLFRFRARNGQCKPYALSVYVRCR